jgi:hypothetical protein
MNNYGLGNLNVTKQNKTKQITYLALNIDKCGQENDIICHPKAKCIMEWSSPCPL